jgi:hypothetical protein
MERVRLLVKEMKSSIVGPRKMIDFKYFYQLRYKN